MADNEWIVESFSNPYSNPDPYEEGASVTDYPLAFGARTAGIGSDLGAVLRSLGESRADPNEKAGIAAEHLGKFTQQLFGSIEDNAIESLSPTSKRDLQAAFTSPEFWSLNSFAMKGFNMAPDVVAAAVPAAIFPGAAAAVGIAAAQGAVLNSASVVDEMYNMTDALSDSELGAQVPMFRQMIDDGMDPEEARREYNRVFRGMRPLMMGAIGAVTNVFGPAGQAARAVGGAGGSALAEAGEGVIKRGLKGAAEGATSEAIQSGSEDYLTQEGAVAGNLQEGIDYGRVAESSATGAVLGGVLGGGIGTVAGRREPTPQLPDDPLVTEALGTGTDSTVPQQEPTSASGASATPGVPDTTVATPEAIPSEPVTASNEPTIAQQMQARKNRGVDYTALPPEQQATINEKLIARGQPVTVVEAAAPDPAQAVAIETTKAETAPPVTMEVTPPIVQTEVPAAVTPPVAQDTMPTPEATGGPAVAEPAPIQQPSPVVETPVEAPVQAPVEAPVEVMQAQPTGPRILRDLTQPDTAAENAAIIARNIKGMETPDDGPKGRNRTIAEKEARTKTREGATAITQKYPPSDQEAGLLSTKPKDVVAARKLILDRAKVISDEAQTMGLSLPKAFRDNANDDDGYNPETLLIMEARRLATKPNPKQSDFQRFVDREFDVRSGSMEQAIASRRAEGDAAMRQTTDVQVDDLKDGDTPTDNLDPEAALIAAEEAGMARPRGKPEPKKADEVPASVEDALDEAMYTTPAADRKAPVVETKKVRKLTVPTKDKPRQESEASRTKRDDLMARIAANRNDKGKADVTPKVTPPEVKVPEKVVLQPPMVTAMEKFRARVEAARQRTNTDPTVAQAVAGNYQKGRVSVNGVAVAIENPKGSIRSNKDPNGPQWSVKMPADYGYIEGTRGADGDPIDVYLGPDHDASYIYVIDQMDMDTHAFDEHKVMMGFKNEQDAIRAYDKAFSDGMGMLRVGDLRKMTYAEFKDWANSDPESRAGLADEDANDPRNFMIDREFEVQLTHNLARGEALPEGYVIDPITKRIAKAVSTRKASDVIWGLDIKNLTGAARVIAGTARAQLTKLAGDVDVHFLNSDDLARLAGRPEDMPPFGYHVFKGDQEAIFVRADLMDNPDKLRHTVLHEVTHAATVRAIMSDRSLNENIRRLGQYVIAAIRERPDMHENWYGLTNTREFIAEAFSNPEFQDMLASLPVPENVAAFFKLNEPVRNLWDALISAVRRAIGLPKGASTMLDAAIRVTEMSMKPRMAEVDAMSALTEKSFMIDGNMKPFNKAVRDTLSSITERPALAPTKGNPHLLGFRTFDNIARMADRYFKGNNPVRTIANLMEGQRVAAIKEFDATAPIIQKLHDLEVKYRGKVGKDGKTVWEDFASLVHDETMAGVYADRPLADQSHITKEGSKDSWARAQHPELARRFAALPDDLKAARLESMNYFRGKQNEVAQKLIRNRIVTLFDVPDPDAMAQRIHDGTMTDADKAILGEAADAIEAAGVLSKINGPYFPLMRRGNFVVKGRYKVTSPGNATKISENEFEFKDKKAAADFAASQNGRPTVRTVYADKTTGETTGTENGKTVRLTAEDMNAEARYRVVVQDRHMEMFDTMKEARRRVAELRAAGMNVDDAVPRAFENYGIQADALSTQMRRLNTVLERRADDRQFTSEQKRELMGTLNELSLSLLGSTRIQSRHLPRRYVAGASKDLVRNTTDYAHSMGNYVAKLDYGRKMDVALSDLDDAVKANAQDGYAAGRTAIQNEIVRRITTPNPASENSKWNSVSSRLLSVSFIDKLMSPSYSLINATQPMMISAPYLAGQYGAGKAYSAMAKAYNDIGSLKAIKQGFADTLSKMKPGNVIPTDPVSLIRARLKNKGEQEMIDILVERGSIDTDSGLEVTKLVQSNKGILGKVDHGMGYLEGIARQMPKNIEAMNRTVVALAAYRLEMGRSGDQARAVQFAGDTVNLTQFNYSSSNSSPYMNHPVLRLMLQFKKYGVGMYQFMGEQAALAIRNENPGDRARAIKSLSYTIGMHVLMAGAMGLPTEPIKLMVMAANGLGLTDWGWGDVEDAQREALADLFGKQFGEMAARGVPRALGVDLSSRMGIDTLMGPFGEPRSNEAQDWKAFVWDTVAGAPAGLVADWAKGVNDLAQGDLVRAAERLVPIKAFSDSIKAYRTMTEGTISEKTGKQIMSPYSVGEAAFRAFGLAPAREAEAFERSGAFYRGRDKQAEVRTEFQKEWVQANGAARGRIWKEIQKWNRGQPVEARLSLSDLRGYQKRLKSDMKKTKEGILARRREQHILRRADETYNLP